MSEAAEGAAEPRPAWQPFTFGGVAAFARGGAGRLLLAEFLVAVLSAVIVVYFLRHFYSPVILRAIQEMPETAKIERGHIAGIDTAIIAETKFLAIAVTPQESAQIGQTADIQLQFRPTDFRVGSVFRPNLGWEFAYGAVADLNLSRSALEPWWGAWQPVYLAYAGLGVVLALFGNWAVLAVFYTIPVKLIAWFGDRELSWRGALRLCSAALMPGALVMDLAILFYASQAIDLLGLTVLFAAHFAVGWVYAAGGAWACPRIISMAKPNPFTP